MCEALDNDWELYGGPTLTFDAGNGRVVAGQALIKSVPGTYTVNVDIKTI